MTAWQRIISAWDLEPSVLAGCAALLLVYFAAQRFRPAKAALLFIAGILVLLLALASPLDVLADTYLFSAHMLQHLLLILVVPPLLLVGIPRELAQRAMSHTWVQEAERSLSNPILSWTVGVGMMWIWHWPPLYNSALAHEPIHIAEHVLFLTTAAIFWWPVIGPIEELRLAPLGAAVYVSGACIAHTVLAILLTFGPAGLYPEYLKPNDPLQILPVLRNKWGLTPQADQQWGGLLMWVPACVVYLGFVLGALARWYRTPEADRFVPLPPIVVAEDTPQARTEAIGESHTERIPIER